MKAIIVMGIVCFITGCSNTKLLANRVVCGVSGNDGFIVSMWGPMGLGSKIDSDDSLTICR